MRNFHFSEDRFIDEEKRCKLKQIHYLNNRTQFKRNLDLHKRHIQGNRLLVISVILETAAH